MHFVDHIFIFLLFVVQPIHGAFSYRAYVSRVEAGGPENRRKQYQDILLLEWLSFAVVGSAWLLLSRPLDLLGFVPPSGSGFWGGIALLVPVTLYLVYLIHAAKKMSDEEKAKQVQALGTLRYILPQNSADLRMFNKVSITAGIVEEFLYRGFTFWYLAQFLPVWAVVVVSSVVFGLGHSYQGIGGMIRVTLIGLAFGLFYVWTGSIWLPMIAHVILDILQGAALVEMFRSTGKSLKAAAAV
jgi:membrane protease YdiL (CAAX protease family)